MLVNAQAQRALARLVDLLQKAVVKRPFHRMKGIFRRAQREAPDGYFGALRKQAEIPATHAVQIFVQFVFSRSQAKRGRKVPPADLRTDPKIGEVLAPDKNGVAVLFHAHGEGKVSGRLAPQVDEHENAVALVRAEGDRAAKPRRFRPGFPRHRGKAKRGEPGVLGPFRRRIAAAVGENPLCGDLRRQGRRKRAAPDRARPFRARGRRNAGLPASLCGGKIVFPAVAQLRRDDCAGAVPGGSAAERFRPRAGGDFSVDAQSERHAGLRGAREREIRIRMKRDHDEFVLPLMQKSGHVDEIVAADVRRIRILPVCGVLPVDQSGVLAVRGDLQLRPAPRIGKHG